MNYFLQAEIIKKNWHSLDKTFLKRWQTDP